VTRLLIWRGVEEWRAEAAAIALNSESLSAAGTQISDDPEPYRVDYRLETDAGFVTRSLLVEATGPGWQRSLDLRRDSDGTWSAEGLDEALDCDLAFSPLTNAMPILRHGLHREPAEREFTMAWVAVPELTVQVSRQRYTHIRPGVVRFETLDSDYVADLELDDDGLVVFYPRLARRVQP
jgi:hypothetical protein